MNFVTASPPSRTWLWIFLGSHLAKLLVWTAEDAFALYVLVVVLRLDPVLAGGVFLAGAAWNAGLDIAWGALLARVGVSRRALAGIVCLAIPLACLSFAMLPLVAKHDQGMAIALIFIFRTSFALFDVPHNGLNSAFTAPGLALVFMRSRTLVSAGAGLVVAFCTLPLMLGGDAGVPSAIFLGIGAAALLGLVPVPLLLVRFWQAPLARRADTREGLLGLAGPILPFCLAQMLGACALGAVGKGLLHLRIEAQWALAAAPLAIAIMRLAIVPAWNALARRCGIARPLALAYLLTGGVMLVLPLAIEAGAPGALTIFLSFGALVGGVGLLAWAGMGQIVSHDPVLSRSGVSSFAFSLFSATSKLGLGASAFVTGQWLAAQPHTLALGQAALWPLATAIALVCGLCAVLTLRSLSRHSEGLAFA